MRDKQEVENPYRDYRKIPGYIPPIRWYQIWRFHQIFSQEYNESRCADKFLAHRIKEIMDSEEIDTA
jgi:hypothetical protein